MSFKEALNMASLNLHVKFFPKWLLALRHKWRRANTAFDELYVRAPHALTLCCG